MPAPSFVPVTVRVLDGNAVRLRRAWVNPAAVAHFVRGAPGGGSVVTLRDGREWHVEESEATLTRCFGGAREAGGEGSRGMPVAGAA